MANVSLGMNQFSYCTNNPIHQADHTGHKPGDLFDTADEAAMNAAYYYGGISFNNGWEYGVSIYAVEIAVTVEVDVIEYRFSGGKWVGPIYSTVTTQRYLTKYTYGEAVTDQNPWGISNIPAPANGADRSALFHTHPMGSNVGKTYFSGTDKNVAAKLCIPSYVYGPNGVLAKYEPDGPGVITIWFNLPISTKTPWEG